MYIIDTSQARQVPNANPSPLAGVNATSPPAPTTTGGNTALDWANSVLPYVDDIILAFQGQQPPQPQMDTPGTGSAQPPRSASFANIAVIGLILLIVGMIVYYVVKK